MRVPLAVLGRRCKRRWFTCSKEAGRAVPLCPLPATVEQGADQTDGTAAAVANHRAFTGDPKISGIGYPPR
jgi:hypothetical protein